MEEQRAASVHYQSLGQLPLGQNRSLNEKYVIVCFAFSLHILTHH